ncbi:ATP-binding protein [Antarctobacter sp.]|uniref:PAS domain-containing sensor histidine kinase n=1 Tax=Antarctobacter sp. TaxID=1872577 RepID=UPI003A91DD09
MEPLSFDILDYVPQAVFALRPIDGEPIYVFWNRTAEKLGGRSRDQVIGKTARDIFQSELGEEAYQRHCEVMRSDSQMEYDLVLDLDDKLCEVRTTLAPVRNARGEVEAIVGSSVILSDQRAAEQNRLEAMALIERARVEMEQYLAFAAHDLRAPMRRMSGLTGLIQEELPDSAVEARKIAAMMEDVSLKAQALISEVLNFSEANNAVSCVETFDLRAMARDIFTVLDPLHKHDLSAERARISTDRVALQIILRNLVDNAIKHRDKGRIRLKIALEDTAEGLAIRVTDNGPGLPATDLQFLDGKGFEYGTGFGLLGIRRLITTRGGCLSASLRPEGGTCFRIKLPSLTRISG